MATNHGVGGSNPSSPTTGPKGKDLSFTSGGRKIMIGIANQKLWNLGVGLLSKWSSLILFFIYHKWVFKIKYARRESAYFFLFYAP